MKKLCVALLCLSMIFGTIAPASAKENPLKDPKILFDIAQKLLSKGDNGIIAVARITRALTFAEGTQWKETLEELRHLENEVNDPDVRFVANALKIIILKKAKTPKTVLLKELQAIIDAAKARQSK